MASGTSNVGVPLRKQESGGAVVERRSRPAHRIVAGRTVRCRKCSAGGGMYGIIGLLPCRQMALRIAAIGGSNRQIIVVVDMAEGAGHIRVAIGEEETR